MFSLTKFAEPLLKWLSSSPDVVLPTSRKNDVEDAIRRGLTDLSISRHSSKVRWGIPVPGDPSHTMYVWVDALANYLTVTGYPWPALPNGLLSRYAKKAHSRFADTRPSARHFSRRRCR